ncbi:MAG TPA: S41 family peptidase, partial [Terriglobales bacterium]
QTIPRLDRELAEVMLREVASDVRKNYYDPKLHGVDWDSRIRETEQSIKRAPDSSEANAHIAALFESLQDSHTFFIPPRNTARVDYGWKFGMVGKRCFVLTVKPGSDAAEKGVHPGDQVLSIEGFVPERQNQWSLQYAMKVLFPLNAVRVELRDSARSVRRLNLTASVHVDKVILGMGDSYSNRDRWKAHIDAENEWSQRRTQFKELGPELAVMRIYWFAQVGREVDALFKKANSHRTLIVDLRGNPGGLEQSVVDHLADVLEHDATIATRVERNKQTPVKVKSNLHSQFGGKLIVLIDSRTASAGEIFARVVQLEKRGNVLGDVSSGHTMESRYFRHQTGNNPVYFYGSSVTISELLMQDGKSIEHVGVTPDQVILPTGADLANERDPVLSRAAEMAGVKLTPEDAAKLFPKRPELD